MRLPVRLFAMMSLLGGAMVLADAPSTAPAPLTAPAIQGKIGAPTELFNGKDLTGWSWVQLPSKKNPAQVKIDDVWSVRDGILHSTGKPNGYIYFEKPFANSIITAEERQIVKGNGGLLVAIKDIPAKGWPGLEIQTMTDNAGDLWNHNLLKMTGDPARTQSGGRRIVKAGPDSQKPVGQWDMMEVTIDHGNLTFKVNGVIQNGVTNTDDLSGKVGLQVEGAEMEFRKITITPIQ